jgi:hypothetical protein
VHNDIYGQDKKRIEVSTQSVAGTGRPHSYEGQWGHQVYVMNTNADAEQHNDSEQYAKKEAEYIKIDKRKTNKSD